LNAKTIILELREAGVELSVTQKRKGGAWVDRIVVRSRGKLTKEILATIKLRKDALIEWLNLPATEDELAAVEKTGRRASPLLTRGDARGLSLLPPPPPHTPWGMLVSDFYLARTEEPLRAWEQLPATPNQRAFAAKLTGIVPPDGATKGECSYVIGRKKKGLPL
jgi:hypothetical protein